MVLSYPFKKFTVLPQLTVIINRGATFNRSIRQYFTYVHKASFREDDPEYLQSPDGKASYMDDGGVWHGMALPYGNKRTPSLSELDKQLVYLCLF